MSFLGGRKERLFGARTASVEVNVLACCRVAIEGLGHHFGPSQAPAGRPQRPPAVPAMRRRALLLLAALAAPAHGLAKGGGFATKAKPKKEKKPKAAAPPPPLPAGMGDVAVERTSIVADGAPAPQFVGSFLMADEDVVDGVMCRQLREEDINLREVVFAHTQTKGPKTYFRGKDAIDGIWVSEEVKTSAAAYLPFDPELRDHRPVVANISKKLLLGPHGPRIKPPAARRLNSKVKRIRQKYIDRLEEQFKKHRILEKTD